MTKLLSRETIQLMMQCQKMIKKEFGMHIHLDDKQAIDQYLAYAKQSNSIKLKTCTRVLREQLVPANADTDDVESGAKAASGVRYYRGQRVTEPVAQPVSQGGEAEKPKSKYVIYRGQKIAC